MTELFKIEEREEKEDDTPLYVRMEPTQQTAAEAGLAAPRGRRGISLLRRLELLASDDAVIYAQLQKEALTPQTEALTSQTEALGTEVSKPAGTAKPGVVSKPTVAKPGVVSKAAGACSAAEVPAVGTVAFAQRKQALLEETQAAFSQFMQSLTAPPRVVLSRCGIPGHCIHSLTTAGEIHRHYTRAELQTPELVRADALLTANPQFAYIEVHGSALCAVDQYGGVKIIAP